MKTSIVGNTQAGTFEYSQGICAEIRKICGYPFLSGGFNASLTNLGIQIFINATYPLDFLCLCDKETWPCKRRVRTRNVSTVHGCPCCGVPYYKTAKFYLVQMP